MSTVRDAQGNILNPVGPGCGRYIDENSTTIDWFATHPRPVEKAKVEFHATAIPAVLPPNSGDTLKIVSPEVPVSPVVETAPAVETPVAEATSAGVTTSSLPQSTVTA